MNPALISRLVCVVIGLTGCAALADEPPVFTDIGYEQALAEATERGKILIVKGTAEWCAPCKAMDRSAWISDGVVRWIESNAIAIALDVDENPGVARALQIAAMPTIIAFRDGREFDRVMGYHNPEALLSWLLDVGRGLRRGQVAPIDPAKAARVRAEIQKRHARARRLSDKGRIGAAADEYAWLWVRMGEREAGMEASRASTLAPEMRRLAVHEEARERFVPLRDDARARFRTRPDEGLLKQWIVLNRVLGDEDRTLEWFDRIKTRPSAPDIVGRVFYLVSELLIERGRYSDFGRFLGDPSREIAGLEFELDGARRRAAQSKDGEAVVEQARARFIERAGVLHASLLAAGRADDAWSGADRLLAVLDGPDVRAGLVRSAIVARCATARHRDLLDPEHPEHAPVVRDLEIALRVPGADDR